MVYISATGHEDWIFTEGQIEKLAFDLGGLAHVIVEPSRNFSFKLRDRSDGRNVFGASVGVSLPKQGFVKRFFLGRQFRKSSEILDAVRGAVTFSRSHMPATGWDWTDFQEQIFKRQRAALSASVSQSDADQLLEDFSAQLADLQAENRQLKDQVNYQVSEEIPSIHSYNNSGNVLDGIVKEIYPGEVVDRIRLAAKIAISVADAKGIDKRSLAVWEALYEQLDRTPALDELLSDLSRATKDPKRMASDVSDLLSRHGFSKSNGAHVKLEPRSGFVGLGNIISAKTPSDKRGMINFRKDIEKILGISNLPE